jgi:AcrR family transcriptional regulator
MESQQEVTKRRIVDAAVSLIGERGWAGTTVRDISRRAGVARSTFYVYFDTKELMFEHSLADSTALIESQLTFDQTGTGPLNFLPSLALLRHFEDHQSAARMVLKTRGRVKVLDTVHKFLVECATTRLPKRESGNSTVPPAVEANYQAGALLGLAVWWIESGFLNNLYLRLAAR